MAADALVLIDHGMPRLVLFPAFGKSDRACGAKTLLMLNIVIVTSFDTPCSVRKLHGVGNASPPAQSRSSTGDSSLSTDQFTLYSQ